MKRASHKSSTFEEDGSTSQIDNSQSKVHRESGASSSGVKNNSTSQVSLSRCFARYTDFNLNLKPDSSGAQNEMDEGNHSMARQEAQKEIEVARAGEDAQQVSRAEIFDQLVAQNDSRTSVHGAHNMRNQGK